MQTKSKRRVVVFSVLATATMLLGNSSHGGCGQPLTAEPLCSRTAGQWNGVGCICPAGTAWQNGVGCHSNSPSDDHDSYDPYNPSCGNANCDMDESRSTCPQDCGSAMTVKLAVGIFKRMRTVLVGDPCTRTCVPVKSPSGTPAAQIEANDNFKALKPSDPAVASYSVRVPLELTLPSSTPTEVRREVYSGARSMSRQVLAASDGKMGLRVEVFEYDVEVQMSRWGDKLWLSPWDAREHMRKAVDKSVDGVLAVTGMYDRVKDVLIALPACGGAFGADLGVGGAGYAWIPYSEKSGGQCMGAQTFLHEWLHQVDWAYQNLMNMSDIYSVLSNGKRTDTYPACGQGATNTLHWFPSSDYCEKDPDWTACGLSSCPDLDAWNAHVLRAHYDFARVYVGNHCRDGVRNFGETGVDSGGDCS